MVHIFSFQLLVTYWLECGMYFFYSLVINVPVHGSPFAHWLHGSNHFPKNKKNLALTHRRTEERQEREICCIDKWRRASTHHVCKQGSEHFQETRSVHSPKCYMDSDTLLLLGLSAGLLASCSSVTSHVLVVNPLHGTASFMSIWTT